ncbi:quinon protein alcohol dehydrogenase-like superfamily [Globomyces pollinis-pini]|nr:quinon protein alcohol dehydrogenase-like superfamily [Globomyces pollinis-pini]
MLKNKSGKYASGHTVIDKMHLFKKYSISQEKVLNEEEDNNIRGYKFRDIRLTEDGKYFFVQLVEMSNLYRVDIEDNFSALEIKNELEFRAWTFHPTEPLVALGELDGKIRILNYLTDPETRQQTSQEYHWHAQEFKALQYTCDGSYLLSGGKEATLVIWQMDTGHKQFLPRLSGEISFISISPDEMQYTLLHKDGCISFVDAVTLKVSTNVSGLKAGAFDIYKYPIQSGLIIDPKNGDFVLNGKPSSLQFFNAKTCETTNELNLSIRNTVVTAGRKPLMEPQLKKHVFSTKGDWLITVDEREAPEFPQESFLKFWKFDETSQTYSINTRVDSPHKKAISGLAFCPSKPGEPLLCGTTSLDGTFKLWELVEAQNERENTRWICRSSGSYKNYVAKSIAFSEDGSTLAVAFGRIITLWDPSTTQLKKTLYFSGPEIYHQPEIFKIQFLYNCPYLISTTRDFFHVWNLLTCSVLWSVRMTVMHIAADPLSSNFVVSAAYNEDREGSLYLFNPHSFVPLQCIQRPRKCLGLVFLKNPLYTSFAELDFTCEITIFEPRFKSKFLKGKTVNNDTIELPVEEKSLFTSMYGSATATPNPVTFDTSTVSTIGSKALEFLQTPTHIMARPSKMVEQFMNSVADLIKPKQLAENDSDEDTLEEVPIELDTFESLDFEFLNDIFKTS